MHCPIIVVIIYHVFCFSHAAQQLGTQCFIYIQAIRLLTLGNQHRVGEEDTTVFLRNIDHGMHCLHKNLARNLRCDCDTFCINMFFYDHTIILSYMYSFDLFILH